MRADKPLAIDLFCGLGGWTEGLLAEGWDVIGFDIERHEYGHQKYPGILCIQSVLTLHGSQFKDAALIVASPPCQGYSYRAMPWSRAKALPPPDNSLFDACFRIQREACEAAGRHIPLIVENVRGAQPWVGRARWNFGSFYLWGDVPALMPITYNGTKKSFQTAAVEHSGYKTQGMNWSDQTKRGQDFTQIAGRQATEGIKGDGSGRRENGCLKSCKRMVPDRLTTADHRCAQGLDDGIKQGGTWWHDKNSASRQSSFKSPKRKAASAMIAKIPTALSRHIAVTFKPVQSDEEDARVEAFGIVSQI